MRSSLDDRVSTAAKRKFRLGPIRLAIGRQIFIKKGLAPFDPHDPYYFAVSLSWTQFFLLFLASEFAINLVFATLYGLQHGSVANLEEKGFLGYLFFSLETLATVGYGQMYPATVYGHVVASLEIVTGLIFTAMMTGLLFVRFSKPKAKVLYATNAVITQHNGRPTLMLRMGNARNNLLQDAQLSLHVLCRKISDEGVRHAQVVEVPLLRPRMPVFAILYTIMHVIDEDSPLHGLVEDSPEAQELRFFLTLIARDPATGQQVSDIHIFEGTSLRFGMRYVDAIKAIDNTKVVADYALLSEIVEATTNPAEADTPESLMAG